MPTFQAKADLYETIVAPVMESINSLIQIEASEGTPSLETIADTVTAVFLENKKQFLILMHNSAPKYTNVRGQLIDLIGEADS